ncbi:unnamed protein product [Blepharisma stoltei]|uniref:Casein kinase I n=1 Tax=Blepharisma stoltei TaxID=1481888 RepID=A0AAU9JN40_9CILI|nr:unnamed protein product [Blepharisma stoltei]
MEGYIRVGGKYVLRKKIGGGSFGEIFLGSNLESQEDVAIKIENATCAVPQVINEAKLMRSIAGVGVPKIYWYGSEGSYNIMVQELLGSSLEDNFAVLDHRMSLRSATMICLQMFQRIENVHNHDYIHRDIKPENFLFGIGKKQSLVYIIDFGLSKKYRDSKTKQHIQYRDNRTLTGTARYASVNSHMGIEQSRRDDLEGIIYVYLYFLKGSLPWQGLKGANKQDKYMKIMNMKSNTSLDVLFRGCPSELVQIMSYIKALRFEETPNYERIKDGLQSIGRKNNFVLDNIFEWNKRKCGSASPRRRSDDNIQVKKTKRIKKKKVKEETKSLIAEKPRPSIVSSIGEMASTTVEHRWPEFSNRKTIMEGRNKAKDVIVDELVDEKTQCLVF